MSDIECAVMTAKQASQYLGISKVTFYSYIKSGLIKKGIVFNNDINNCPIQARRVWRKKYLDEFLDRLEQEQTAGE